MRHYDSKTAQGMYLRMLRVGLGLTQADLAERANVHRATVVRAETGRHAPWQSIYALINELRGSFEEWALLKDAEVEAGRDLANRRIDVLRKTKPDDLREIIRQRRKELDS